MADVSFDEEPQYTSTRANAPTSYGVSKKDLLMKLGIARSPQESQYILIGIAVLCIIFAAFILIKQNVRPAPKVPALPPGVLPRK